MTEIDDSTQEPRKVVVRIKKAPNHSGQMSLFGEVPVSQEPQSEDKRLMILLGLKSVEELNRVLSEPPNEKVLETIGDPDELYALEEEDDLIESALWEIEDVENTGTEAIFFTKKGEIAVIPVPNPAPSKLGMVREFSPLHYRILPEPVDLNRCNWAWVTFERRGNAEEFLIYEQV